MRLPDSEHTSRPWRIHELTRDFRVEDVWALLAAGRREDFPRLVAAGRGWRIRRAAPDFVLLSAGSRLGMPGELQFKRERSGLVFATFVQQRNFLARAVWGRAEPAHERVVSSLLTQAARREGPPGPRSGDGSAGQSRLP